MDRITNARIYEQTGTKPLSQEIEERRMRFAGHVLRMSSMYAPKTAMTWQPSGKRKRGRPRHTWHRTFHKDLEARNLDLNPSEVEEVANDRPRWRLLAAQCTTQCRRN